MTNDSYDEFERELLKTFERGALKRSKLATGEMKLAREAAANYLQKNSRINIRLSGTDLTLLKRKAVQEGLPYQTLIASVLHKYVTGHLVNRNP